MDSSFQQQQYKHHFQDPERPFYPHQNNLTRFRSAPSAYFSTFLEMDIFEGSCEIPENSPANQTPPLVVEVKQEGETLPQLKGSFVTSPQPLVYQSLSKPPLANHKSSSRTASTSMGINPMPPHKKINNDTTNNDNSELTRHSSSPAGFFAGILNILDKGQSQPLDPSSSGKMNQSSLDSFMSENLSNMAEDEKNFPGLDTAENQSEERLNRPPRLAHHLSLRKTLSDISEMEKLLFEDSVVPCRIRAKRGCATHPRSIAERVRRTKISERMRKLQDLVPNMDKQTNTADMLDLAVEYIKDLQKQVKILTDYRANCTCLRYTYS